MEGSDGGELYRMRNGFEEDQRGFCRIREAEKNEQCWRRRRPTGRHLLHETILLRLLQRQWAQDCLATANENQSAWFSEAMPTETYLLWVAIGPEAEKHVRYH